MFGSVVNRGSPAALVAVAATLAVLALAVAPGSLGARVLGAALVVFLPGLALTGALLGGETSPLRRAILSIASSWCLAIACALLLNLTPIGVDATAMGIVLGVVTLVAAVMQHAREASWRAAAPPGIAPATILLLAAAAVITIAAFVASGAALASNRATFTQLWLTETADGAVRIGVFNGERGPETYTVELSSDLTHRNETVTLRPDQSWETTVSLPAGTQSVRAVLYRGEKPSVAYRTATLRLTTP